MRNLFTMETQRAQRKDMTLTAETQRRGGNNPEKSPLIPLLQRGRFFYSPLWQRGGRGDSRKGYKTTAFFILLLLISACGGGGGGGSSPAGPSTTVVFSGSSSGYNVYMARNSSLSSGSVLAVDVMVNNVSNVYGAAFDVDFDSSRMTYSGYVKGDFLGTVEPNVILQSGSSNKLVVGVSKQGTATGATGSGTLVTLKFNVTSGGSLAFSNSAIKDPSNLTISGVTWTGGIVTVQ